MPHDDIDPLYQDLVATYAQLEPGEEDTWNPLTDEVELNHRLELQKSLVHAMRESRAGLAGLRVLDVGCGTGRSSRMYVDLGVLPEQVIGIDLRPGALARARRAHSGIRYLQYSGSRLPLDDRSADWVSLCTVMSSVSPGPARSLISSEIGRVLRPQAFLFYWDLATANPFAGGDALDAGRLFPDLELVWSRTVRLQGLLERERESGAIGARVESVGPTHRAALLKRTE